MSNEAQIASKAQKQLFDLTNQTITELSIRIKERLRQKFLEDMNKRFGPAQMLQQNVLEHPDKYHVIYLERGDAEALKQLMDEHDIMHLDLAPSVIEHNAGGFIISDTDYKVLKELSNVHIQHRYSKKQLDEQDLDENGETKEERQQQENHDDHDQSDNEHKGSSDDKSEDSHETKDKSDNDHKDKSDDDHDKSDDGHKDSDDKSGDDKHDKSDDSRDKSDDDKSNDDHKDKSDNDSHDKSDDDHDDHDKSDDEHKDKSDNNEHDKSDDTTQEKSDNGNISPDDQKSDKTDEHDQEDKAQHDDEIYNTDDQPIDNDIDEQKQADKTDDKESHDEPSEFDESDDTTKELDSDNEHDIEEDHQNITQESDIDENNDELDNKQETNEADLIDDTHDKPIVDTLEQDLSDDTNDNLEIASNETSDEDNYGIESPEDDNVSEQGYTLEEDQSNSEDGISNEILEDNNTPEPESIIEDDTPEYNDGVNENLDDTPSKDDNVVNESSTQDADVVFEDNSSHEAPDESFGNNETVEDTGSNTSSDEPERVIDDAPQNDAYESTIPDDTTSQINAEYTTNDNQSNVTYQFDDIPQVKDYDAPQESGSQNEYAQTTNDNQINENQFDQDYTQTTSSIASSTDIQENNANVINESFELSGLTAEHSQTSEQLSQATTTSTQNTQTETHSGESTSISNSTITETSQINTTTTTTHTETTDLSSQTHSLGELNQEQTDKLGNSGLNQIQPERQADEQRQKEEEERKKRYQDYYDDDRNNVPPVVPIGAVHEGNQTIFGSETDKIKDTTFNSTLSGNGTSGSLNNPNNDGNNPPSNKLSGLNSAGSANYHDGFGGLAGTVEYKGPGPNDNDFYVEDDVMLDNKSGRGRETLENATYNAYIGGGVDEAKGEGLKRSKQLLNNIAGGSSGLTGLYGLKQDLENTLTPTQIQTLSQLMIAHGKKTGNGNTGIDFSTPEAIERSMQNISDFFVSTKAVEQHGAMGLHATLAVDSKMEYGRNKFGRENARNLRGDYRHDQGVFTTNYEYAKQSYKQLQNMHNKGKKAGSKDFIDDAQVNDLLKTLQKDNGVAVQGIINSFDNYKRGTNMRKGKGGQKLISYNWRNNAAVQKALAEDEMAQGAQKPAQLVSEAKQLHKGILTASKFINQRASARLTRKEAEQAKKIADLAKAGRKGTKRYTKAEAKAQRILDRKQRAIDRADRRTEQILRNERFGTDLKNNLKTRLKQSASRQLNKSRVGKAVLRRVNALNTVRNNIIMRYHASVFGRLARGINGLRTKIMEFLLKIALKVIAWFLNIFLFTCKVAVIAALIGMMLDLISMFTLGNNRLEDDPAYGDIEASIMGSVYNQLSLSETKWVQHLKFDLFDIENPVWLDELDGRYTAWLPDGSVDFDHFHMSAEDYVTEIIGTDYVKQEVHTGILKTESSGIAKGPEPFPGAPEGGNTPDDPGAYKWIRLLDGGVEVRFRGIGNTAGRTSNIKEIMAMTAVVQTESQVVDTDIDAEGAAEVEDGSAWSKLGTTLKKVWNGVTNFLSGVVNALTTGLNKLLRTIPSYDEWWQNAVAKDRSKIYMLYASPLFEYSHTEEYSLSLGLRPTLKTQETWLAEHPEEVDADVDETAYQNWGDMCSGIVDQTIYRKYEKGKELNEAGTNYGDGEHGGYGCMEFDGFAFKYDSDQDMYYDDVLAPQVKASWDVDNEEDICVAPGNDGMRWLEVTRDYGHEDCWIFVNPNDTGWHKAGPNEEYGQAEFIDNIAGSNEGYVNIYSEDGGNTYTVEVAAETEERGNGTYRTEYDLAGNPYQVENTDTWSHVVTYTWAHSCVGDHTGYYCGGHFKIIVTGGIYHMSVPQLMHNRDAFEEKYVTAEKLPEYEEQLNELGYSLDACYDDEGTLTKHFHVLYDNETGDPFLVNYVGRETEKPSIRATDACRDLFDIDASYTHRYGHVNVQETDGLSSFFGWDYAFMDVAASKLEEDWYSVYGIIPTETIGGTEGGTGSAGGLATTLEDARMNDILLGLDELYGNDPTWPARREAVATALQYVGKVAYSQAKHGTSLADGSLNDCSGYVSQCWKDILQQNYTTASFYNKFKPSKWNGNTIKPGDIILHYDGAIADGSGDHALIYIGKDPVTGEDMSVDCTGSGTHYRNRGSNYYNNAYVINMDEVLGY